VRSGQSPTAVPAVALMLGEIKRGRGGARLVRASSDAGMLGARPVAVVAAMARGKYPGEVFGLVLARDVRGHSGGCVGEVGHAAAAAAVSELA
jgi:hypothetical protein